MGPPHRPRYKGRSNKPLQDPPSNTSRMGSATSSTSHVQQTKDENAGSRPHLQQTEAESAGTRHHIQQIGAKSTGSRPYPPQIGVGSTWSIPRVPMPPNNPLSGPVFSASMQAVATPSFMTDYLANNPSGVYQNFLIGQTRRRVPMVAFRRFTTVLEGRPPHLDHMLPPIVVPESGASQFDIFEDFLFICSMAQHSIDMRLIQAALCHQMSATENGRGVAVRATLDILKLGIGPITGVGEDIWRAMDVVYRLENDALRFAVVRHVSENYEFYRELWEEDMDDREKREAERGSEEGGILRAAFGDQAWWWESGMMAKVMEREAGNARDAVVERGMEASGRYTFERA